MEPVTRHLSTSRPYKLRTTGFRSKSQRGVLVRGDLPDTKANEGFQMRHRRDIPDNNSDSKGNLRMRELEVCRAESVKGGNGRSGNERPEQAGR
jgi:hypothetical protein